MLFAGWFCCEWYFSFLGTGRWGVCNDHVISMYLQRKVSFLLKLVDFSGRGLLNMWELQMLLRACGRSYAFVKEIPPPADDWFIELSTSTHFWTCCVDYSYSTRWCENNLLNKCEKEKQQK